MTRGAYVRGTNRTKGTQRPAPTRRDHVAAGARIEAHNLTPLFCWPACNSQISHGVSPGSYTVLIITSLRALAPATLAFGRLDIH